MYNKGTQVVSANREALGVGEYRQRRKPNVRIRVVGAICATIAFALAITALVLLSHVFEVNEQSLEAHSKYSECSQAASDLMAASDYLTNAARLFVVSGERAELDNYLREVNVVDRRTISVETLMEDFGGTRAYTALVNANAESHSLSNREFYAMRLAADAYGLDDLPAELVNVNLKEEDDAHPTKEKRALAEEMVMGDQYQLGKDIIITQVGICATELIEDIRQEEHAGSTRLAELLHWLRIIVFALLAIIAIILFVVFYYVVAPLADCAVRIGRGEALTLNGAHELCVVSDAYNDMFEDISHKNELLTYEASHDALTDVLNRGSYDHILGERWSTCALALVDVDRFKEFNDDYGHAAGDKILQSVATALHDAFRTGDYVCRIGGDEFAVIVVDVTAADHDMILGALRSARSSLRSTPREDLPSVTISCGVAFGADVEGGRDGLYRAADVALYDAKRNGRDGISFFDDTLESTDTPS